MKTKVTIPTIKKHCEINKIAIFGSADVDESHPLFQDVFNVARTLAYHDKIVIDGGGPGVMQAATQGAQSAGGETLAVTFYPKDMPEFEGRSQDNVPDVEIKTANYVERMFGLIEQADAFICFQGGTGTLSEWSTVWLMAHLYYGNHKPVIMYGEFWKDLMKEVNEHFFIGEKENQVYTIVKDEQELMQAIDKFELELAERCELPRLTVGSASDRTGQITS